MIMRASEAGLALTRRALAAAALMLAVAASTATLKPKAALPSPAPDLEALLPEAFGEWTRIAVSRAVLPEESALGPGEAVAYRAYRDGAGRIVTLVAAFGPPLGDSVRLHRPESCYVAQGYTIARREIGEMAIGARRAALVRLTTEGPTQDEIVTYWLRSGPDFITAAPSAQAISFDRAAWRPRDGALVRVSSAGSDPALFALQEAFLTAFAATLGPEARAILIGGESDAS